MKKISRILIITLILIFVISTVTFGEGKGALDPKYFEPGEIPKDDYDTAFERAGIIVKTIRNIGAVVSVIGIAVLGIRYMFASLEQKANYKETMLPFMIGIAMAVSATTIITIVQNVAIHKEEIETHYCGNCDKETERNINGMCKDCGQ